MHDSTDLEVNWGVGGSLFSGKAESTAGLFANMGTSVGAGAGGIGGTGGAAICGNCTPIR